MRNPLKIFVPVLVISIIISACSGKNEAVYELGKADDCDSAEMICAVSNNDYTAKLKLGPKVTPLQNFPVELTIANSEGLVHASDVIIDFQMIGMDMGLNRYKLNHNDHLWHGNATLPVCVASRMDWIAIVEFTDQSHRFRAVFPFHTDRN